MQKPESEYLKTTEGWLWTQVHRGNMDRVVLLNLVRRIEANGSLDDVQKWPEFLEAKQRLQPEIIN